jgi:hypothetical protein
MTQAKDQSSVREIVQIGRQPGVDYRRAVASTEHNGTESNTRRLHRQCAQMEPSVRLVSGVIANEEGIKPEFLREAPGGENP